MSSYQANGKTIVITEIELSHFRLIAKEYMEILNISSETRNIWIYSIKKVDNISCDVHIYYDIYVKKLRLEINDGDFTEKKIYARFDLTEKEISSKSDITHDDMVEAVINMRECLSTCKFDKFSGSFNNVGMMSFYELFKDCDSVDLKIK